MCRHTNISDSCDIILDKLKSTKMHFFFHIVVFFLYILAFFNLSYFIFNYSFFIWQNPIDNSVLFTDGLSWQILIFIVIIITIIIIIIIINFESGL